MTDEIPLEYFAQLDANNTVISILTVGQNVLVDEQGNPLSFPESEPVGQQFLQSLFGADTVWKQTDYNSPPAYRENTAVIGCIYDPVNDIFTGVSEPEFSDDSDIQSNQLF